MRTIVVKEQTTFEALARSLTKGQGNVQQMIEQLIKLNPHLDPKKPIEAGTVVLVPRRPGGQGPGPDGQEPDTSSIEGDAFEALRKELLESVAAASDRVLLGHASRLEESKSVIKDLQSEAMKRAEQIDQGLRSQVEAALERFGLDEKDAKEAEAMLKAVQTSAAVALEELAKTLG